MANNQGEESTMQLANAETPNPVHTFTTTESGEPARPKENPHTTTSSYTPVTHSPLQLLQSSVAGLPSTGVGQSRPLPTSRVALFTRTPPTNTPEHDKSDCQDSNFTSHTSTAQTTTTTSLLTSPYL